MWSAVRSGGVLAVEDADMDSFCCHPPNEAFDFFMRSYRDVLHRRGGDVAIGRKLYSYFLAVGIPDPSVALVQSLWMKGDEKMLPWSTLEATADAIVSERVASKNDVARALANLKRFTKNPRTLVCGPRVFQVWARRRTGRRKANL
jgi:hypothetical protein